ncbi:E3 ubiquitin-protein ligase IAP-3 [Frankliniella fusca]|uniref:E3 ubiquitin-protein ligase IAP-3 n=1 Tax=Frankliniella fusca TaxID=407009 RepID=A0AAE1H6M2_9NEOP|nr:E3 ubiquitin-protein ligase IAP-3 [Frankliniella fusca]
MAMVFLIPPTTPENQVNPPETEEDYKSEEVRLKSYNGFPSAGLICIRSLAASGFWFTKRSDWVKCAFCEVSVGHWDVDDTAMSEHLRWSPDCPFLKGEEVGNIPLSAVENLRICGVDECSRHIDKTLEELGLWKRKTHKHPAFSVRVKRLASFSKWVGLVDSKKMADAGFFYAGNVEM